MPDRTACKYCGKIGFIRRERVIKGGRSIESFYCGSCNRSWDIETKTGDGIEDRGRWRDKDGTICVDLAARVYADRVSPEQWRLAFERLCQRIKAAKLHACAICSDAAATLEQIRRARAARQGVSYTAEDAETFVPADRSRHIH